MFQIIFNQLIHRLRDKIAGRESSDAYVNSQFEVGNRPTDYFFIKAPVTTSDGMFDFRFAIQDDCPCSAINAFVEKASLSNLTFALGPRGGKVLGINGNSIPNFYAYHRP